MVHTYTFQKLYPAIHAKAAIKRHTTRPKKKKLFVSCNGPEKKGR